MKDNGHQELTVRIDTADEAELLIEHVLQSYLNKIGLKGDALISREAVEAAMDAYDRYSQSREHAEIFDAFGEPRDYWVRSTRERPNRVYPSKPILGHLLVKTKLNGGWSNSSGAAARLHNAGFVIVDENNTPVELPENRSHLICGRDRVQAVAAHYFIGPARDRHENSVIIRAGTLRTDFGLLERTPQICAALEDHNMKRVASVSTPVRDRPENSRQTTFTYHLKYTSNAEDMMQPNQATSASATNLILYGPPGTGKTFASAAEAVRLCGEPVPQDRAELMAVYQRLVAAGRIEFVTFHQSMSYEDFVEGRQPMTGVDGAGETESAGFRLETVHGVFRRIAKRAETSRGRSSGDDMIRLEGRQVFKMSIGEANNPEDAHLFEEAIDGGYTLLGFDDIDWSDEKYASREAIFEACKNNRDGGADIDARSGWVQMPFRFRNWVRQGDIVIVSKGNQQFRAIGEFVGDYEFKPRPEGGYAHRRAVRWLWVDRDGVPVSEIYSRGFMQQSIYLLYDSELNIPALERYMNSQRSDEGGEPDQFVLIIDEINRANISRVFGELITLLEADKRLNQPNAVRVRLPYSGDEFGVPSNLHILGTMNTADRSIALLDTALRRRFTFREMMPDESILKEAAEKCGIDLPRLLTTINERIEYLYDREHQIGHAYFTACGSRADVDEVMRHKVIPLLAEYFFEDWAKIAAVLGDLEPGEGSISGGFLKRAILKPPPGLEDGDAVARFRWQVRSVNEGFDYTKLVGK